MQSRSTQSDRNIAPQRKNDNLISRMSKEYSGPSVVPPHTVDPLPKAKSLSVVREENWEIQALKGIKKKKLSLDRQWTKITWHNKSSIPERLKLLKDDGYDITPLQGPNISSESVTQSVIARMEARQSRESSTGARRSLLTDRDNALSTNAFSTNVLSTTKSAQESSIGPTLENALDRSEPSHPLKRRRDSEEIEHNAEEQVFKKPCQTDVRAMPSNEKIVVDEILSWNVLKHKVLSAIFKASREHMDAPSSHIIISFPSQSRAMDVPGDVSLNSKGYDNIMKELTTLSDNVDDVGTIEIQDPRSGRCGIRVLKNISLQITIEGHLENLMALIRRLMTTGNGLMHMEKRFFDNAGARRGTGETFELSDKTQEELSKIHEKLEAGMEQGRVDVQVRWTDAGRAGQWIKEKV